MTRIRRWAGTLLAGALPILALSILVPVPAGAVAEPLLLSLEPTSAPPGSAVSWVASGFEGCPPADDAVSEGVVVLQWDGTGELARVVVSATDGTAASTFFVPESAEFGQHRVTVTCLDDPGIATTSLFTVDKPVVVQVPVPNVVGLSEDEARSILERENFKVEVTEDGDVVQSQDPVASTLVDPGEQVTIDLGEVQPETALVPSLVGLRLAVAQEALEDAELEVGGVSGDPEGVVTDQSPETGNEVPLGTAVSISLAQPPPPFVRVPPLVGESVDTVPGILVGAGLTLGLVSGNGDVVLSQRPLAGRRVPRNSEVNVSVERNVLPEDLVAVPNLVGSSSADARSVLVSAGLLGGGDDADGEVTGQQPPAGTLVAGGSTVSLVVQGERPWLLVLGVPVVLVAVAGAAYSPLRRSSDRRWLRKSLGVRKGGGRLHEAAVADVPGGGSPPTQVIQVRPQPFATSRTSGGSNDDEYRVRG